MPALLPGQPSRAEGQANANKDERKPRWALGPRKQLMSHSLLTAHWCHCSLAPARHAMSRLTCFDGESGLRYPICFLSPLLHWTSGDLPCDDSYFEFSCWELKEVTDSLEGFSMGTSRGTDEHQCSRCQRDPHLSPLLPFSWLGHLYMLVASWGSRIQ